MEPREILDRQAARADADRAAFLQPREGAAHRLRLERETGGELGSGPILRLTAIKRGRLVHVLQDRAPGTIQVVELAAGERAPEQPADQEHDGDGEGDEEDEAFHAGLAAPAVPAGETRSALSTTMKELAAMPTAASQGPIQPAAASGSAPAL